MTLLLRELRIEDEAQVRAAQLALAEEDFVFAFGLADAPSFAAYLATVQQQRRGEGLSPSQVPATFLVAEIAGQIVGRLSLRHTLNERLLRDGGHIGYGVLAEHRGRGYATEILRQALIVARSLGLARVLLTCHEQNFASRRVIEKCGGQYHGSAQRAGDEPRRHYWIELSHS